jgi:DNA-binding XRE family transcriptional regulator
MGEVIRLPVRREQPQEETARPRREPPTGPAVSGAVPPDAPGPAEPLWRESVGRELREERLTSGKWLVDVAKDAGVSPQYLSEVERGRKDPSSELLAAMAGALGLSVAEIATRVGRGGTRAQSPVCLAA